MNPFLRTIDALNAHAVRYVVVGGFAAYMHGSRRVTVDLDLVVDLGESAARNAIQALDSIGLQSRIPVDPYLFADGSQRSRWIAEENTLVFSMFDPSHPGFVVDLFIDSSPRFEELDARANEVQLDGRPVRICSIPDLIQMKEKAGRPQDLDDFAALRRVQSLDQKPPGPTP